MSRTLSEEDFARAAARIGCHVAAVKAVAEVESVKGPFNPDGSLPTLFEGHWFSKLTRGRYDKSHPEISYPKWTRQFYGNWQKEQARLIQASSLDRDAALKSTSWGQFQIMGFNHLYAGFSDAEDMVHAMGLSAGAQLDAFVELICSDRFSLADEMQAFPQDWAIQNFPRVYNGPSYKANQYDLKLRNSFMKHRKAYP